MFGTSQFAVVAMLAGVAGLSALALAVISAEGAQPPDAPEPVVLVIHGGAGALPKKEMTPEREKQYRGDLGKALRAGHAVLQKKSGTSLDAVEAAIRVLEDSPLFNAGKGAVFTAAGTNELDASIMEGKEKKAGAVAGVKRVKNPISAARAVMERTPHVMLIGPGADAFAKKAGLEMVDASYFKTDERWRYWKEVVREEEERKKKGKGPAKAKGGSTVGAVALDRHGNLAAGTSTGGLTNRMSGRVGDSPVIGAGTYCDNAACGVSCTGYGELFIREGVAHEVVALMKYRKLSVAKAAAEVIGRLPEDAGGLIALDSRGNVAMTFNSEGMYRGYITRGGKTHIAIYKE